ncbi:ETS domain-containing protein [Caenorhabditis elegans]|uniref:ETS domain-containing protein n=1 Tax=Caenorhabditis elegans TaxID=6239 RepID=O44138_CAEEL|nr:ETS domain-containing protein [Caenorhabditis elegans]CCD67237.2 ETS domain-containing protein [Caenorhabditis elegans]|eukprot:NP_500046.2 ETS class transcription factor [Caenorhabditis elegans]
MVSSTHLEPGNQENRNPKNPRSTSHKKLRNYLFQMILKSENDKNVAKIIKWTKKSSLEFQMVDRQEVARLWGAEKGNLKMDYEFLSRSIRSYYKSGIMRKIPGKDFRYQFIADSWTSAQLAQHNKTKKLTHSISAILGQEN